MALTAISPFPADTAPTQLRAALDILRHALNRNETTAEAGQYDAEDRLLQRIGTAVSARVEKYAPGAPDAVRSEAVIRASAYLWDTVGSEREWRPDRPAGARTLNPGGTFAATEWQPAETFSAGWFRRSGAMSLLSPWRVRGVGLVETT